MTPAELLTGLADASVMADRASDGRVALSAPRAPDPALLAATRRYRWVLTWGVHGAITGHRWHVCDVCGDLQLQHHRSDPIRCSMTAGCKGRMRPGPDIFERPSTMPSPAVTARQASS